MPLSDLDDDAVRRRVWWGIALALGLMLRLWFVRHPMPFDDDTDVYAELGTNFFHHGVYGLKADGAIVPTLIRLPGYPLFLGTIFAIFGTNHYQAVVLAQIAIDLMGCWLIARFVREQVSERAGTVALVLASLCPFTAAYATIALTECLSIFAVSLALWSSARLMRAQANGRRDGNALGMVAAAMALAMLLRPDGVLLSVTVVVANVWYGWRQGRLKMAFATGCLCGSLAVVPLMPWAARNWRTFHVLQPLAPRRVNDPGELVNYGFYRWMSTWSVDLVSTINVFWRVGTETIDVGDLPARAYDSPAQRTRTAEILSDYNQDKTVTRALDARFDALAAERLKAHPLLCRVWVPMLRVGDMWLRPRTETLDLDAFWWRIDKHRTESVEAIGLGLLNLALLAAAVVGAVRTRVGWIVLPVAYVVLRCLLLSTMENSEPRYTIEAFPMVFAYAACAFGAPRREQRTDCKQVPSDDPHPPSAR